MKITKYIRYSAGTKISYGILEEQTIRELHGDIFGGAEPTGTTVKLSEVKVLAPCEPSKVIAVGRNYKSHIADRNIEPPKEPGLFLKPSSCLVGTEGDIVIPEGANNVHYEAELVVVIGKKGKNVSEAEAEAYARWLSNRDGLKYRLPTEEEWEYVARNGGSTKLYPWGNEWKDGYANTSSKSVSAVKSFKQGATKSGVFDMIGNVWEWTSSKVSAYSGNKEWNVPPEDQGRMVIRGGSYQSKIGADQPSTSTGRNWLDPSDKHPTVGFRLVREAP